MRHSAPRCRIRISIRRFIFLGNIDPTLQRSVLKQVRRKPKVVGLDTMNYWIERTPAELRETLKHVDILTINDDETRQLTSEHNLLRAAKHIFKMGPSTLIIKRGEHGALMVHDKFMFSVPAFPLEEVRDPTGAGDTFAGGFMGYLAAEGRVNERRSAPRWSTARCSRASPSSASESSGWRRSRARRSPPARGGSRAHVVQALTEALLGRPLAANPSAPRNPS